MCSWPCGPGQGQATHWQLMSPYLPCKLDQGPSCMHGNHCRCLGTEQAPSMAWSAGRAETPAGRWLGGSSSPQAGPVKTATAINKTFRLIVASAEIGRSARVTGGALVRAPVWPSGSGNESSRQALSVMDTTVINVDCNDFKPMRARMGGGCSRCASAQQPAAARWHFGHKLVAGRIPITCRQEG